MNKQMLVEQLINIDFNVNDFIVVCIGTKKSYLDSVGPKVGTRVSNNTEFVVYGTIKDNCHALSLEEKFKEIKKLYSDKKILAIDACCTKYPEKLGKIELLKGPIFPGAGVGKNLPCIGDFSIKAFTIDKDSQDLVYDAFLEISCNKQIYMNYVDNAVNIISDAIIEVNKLNIQGGILYE